MAPRKSATAPPPAPKVSVETRSVDDLQQHPRNPRKGHLGVIAESIQENGWYGVLIVQKSTGYILAGNHRFEAGRLGGDHFGLGDKDKPPYEPMRQFPCHVVDVDQATALRIVLVDNKSSDVADYDREALADLLEELRDIDPLDTSALFGTGYDGEELKELLITTGRIPPAEQGYDRGKWVPTGGRYKHQYGVIVVCEDERQQERVYKELAEKFAEVKIVVT